MFYKMLSIWAFFLFHNDWQASLYICKTWRVMFVDVKWFLRSNTIISHCTFNSLFSVLTAAPFVLGNVPDAGMAIGWKTLTDQPYKPSSCILWHEMSLMHTFFAKEQISSSMQYLSHNCTISNICFEKKNATAFAWHLCTWHMSRVKQSEWFLSPHKASLHEGIATVDCFQFNIYFFHKCFQFKKQTCT